MDDTTFWSAITGLCKGVKNVDIHRSSQLTRVNWQNEIEAGNLGEEFWIVDAGPTIEEDLIMDGACYRRPLTIFYARSSKPTDAESLAGTSIASAVEAVIESLRQAFTSYSGTAFQLMGRNPTTDLREDNPANLYLFALQARMFAGALVVEPMVGEYY